MRDVALGAGNAFHQSEFVEFDYRLGQIEVDGSAPLSFAIQDQGEVAHHLESADQICVTFSRNGIAFEYRVNIGIGHAFGGTNDAFAQLIPKDFATMVDLHDAGKHEPVDMRAQAADVGRKLKRQHGHGAIGEINAGAAQPRFLIERRIGRDVVGHVGDMYLEFVVPALNLTNSDGIVEVAGGFAVDGDDREIAEITPLLDFRRWNDGLNTLCAWARTSAGKRCGRWNLRMTISTSTPKSSS